MTTNQINSTGNSLQEYLHKNILLTPNGGQCETFVLDNIDPFGVVVSYPETHSQDRRKRFYAWSQVAFITLERVRD